MQVWFSHPTAGSGTGSARRPWRSYTASSLLLVHSLLAVVRLVATSMRRIQQQEPLADARTSQTMFMLLIHVISTASPERDLEGHKSYSKTPLQIQESRV